MLPCTVRGGRHPPSDPPGPSLPPENRRALPAPVLATSQGWLGRRLSGKPPIFGRISRLRDAKPLALAPCRFRPTHSLAMGGNRGRMGPRPTGGVPQPPQSSQPGARGFPGQAKGGAGFGRTSQNLGGFRVGDTVVVEGLQSATELNGCTAVVVALKVDRLEVQFDQDGLGKKSLKPTALRHRGQQWTRPCFDAHPGDTVVLFGLTKSVYNGLRGIVQSEFSADAPGRYTIRVNGVTEGETLHVRPESLAPAGDWDQDDYEPQGWTDWGDDGPPRKRSRMEDPGDGKGPFPNGWGSAVDAKGRTYYLDHKRKVTSWQDPRSLPTDE
eukprot:Hpha_TRINITY_DN10214_c0_g1::TRINITY_DN10214_c0_g1_i1::g.35148::m.35148